MTRRERKAIAPDYDPDGFDEELLQMSNRGDFQSDHQPSYRIPPC